MSAQESKANFGRRQLLLAGTPLPVLSMPRFDTRSQQAQAQAPTRHFTGTATGVIVDAKPSDTAFAIQAKVNSVPAGGTLLMQAGTYDGFIGKSGITVRAAGAVTIKGNVDFQKKSNWTLDGWVNGSGSITFPRGGVNASASTGGAVVGCIFNDTTVNFGDNGCAVALSDASNLLVANNAFNRCQGGVLGTYNWN